MQLSHSLAQRLGKVAAGTLVAVVAGFLGLPSGLQAQSQGQIEGFEIFSGLGLTDIDVDAHVNNPDVDLTKSTLSVHAGVGYRAMLGDNLYLRPEARARIYEAGNSTVDISASIALGWSWDND